MPLNEVFCPSHLGAEHCWHQAGEHSYKGRYEKSTPVYCCHCGRAAVRHYAVAERIEFPGRDGEEHATRTE